MRIQAEVAGGMSRERIWTGSGQEFPDSMDRERRKRTRRSAPFGSSGMRPASGPAHLPRLVRRNTHAPCRRQDRRQRPAGPRQLLRLPAEHPGLPGHPAHRLHHRQDRQEGDRHSAPEGRPRQGASLERCRSVRRARQPGCIPGEADRHGRLLVRLPVRDLGRHRRAQDPRVEPVHRAGSGVPAEHHRRRADLRDRRCARRRRRRGGTQADGGHADRQDRARRRPRADPRDRDLHGPRPAQHRAADRDDHVRGAARHARPRRRAGVRARRPRGRGRPAPYRLRQRPAEQGPGQARHGAGQAPRRARGRPARGPCRDRRQRRVALEWHRRPHLTHVPGVEQRAATDGRPPAADTTHQAKETHLMPTTEDIKTWRGHGARSSDGDKLGKIEDIYLDQETGKPEWMAVKTGMFGGRVSFVPLAEASLDGDVVTVPYDKAKIKDAPHAEADGQLSQQEERELYRHYGLDYSEARSDSGLADGDRNGGRADRSSDPTPDGSPDVVGNDVSGPETDRAMTRSEEELRVGTTQRETGRARLRKYVVTENVTKTVPVQREEVRIEREPVTDANLDDAMDGPPISEEEHEIVLHEEQPVVEKNVVAKERVRLDKDVMTEDAEVSEEVRKERIEADGEGLR